MNFVTNCPHCKRANTVEKSASTNVLQTIRCSHCRKDWSEDLDAGATLTKSAPMHSAEMEKLRQSIAELSAVVNGYLQRQVAARSKFNPQGVEKSDVAAQELTKALSNGKPVGAFEPAESGRTPKFQTVDSVGSGQRVRSGAAFDTNGMEKTATADAELQKALANPKRVTW